MREEPIWFGPSGRPLAGWVHAPASGTARGAVVLCEPIGLERVPAHRAGRSLCQQLAARGLMALRFHYDGTGDSAGASTDPDRMLAWLTSIEAALDMARAIVPDAPVALVGVRLGASLAAVLADQERDAGRALDALVLWDPCVSGSQFLRQQGALGRITGGAPQDDGGVDAPGFYFNPPTAGAVGGLDLTTIATAPAPQVLVLARVPGGRAAVRLGERWRAGGANVVVSEVDGQAEMLDVPSPRSRLPRVTVASITSYLDDTLRGPAVALGPWPVASSAVMPTARGPVVERFVRLGEIGMFGVECSPPPGGGVLPVGRTVVLLNNAAESHIGPVRLWVEISRRLAATGVRCVRVDLSGLGDSPTRLGSRPDVIYADCVLDDIREILAGLESAPSQTVLSGLCSGAHIAIHASAALDVAAFVAVNTATTVPAGPMTVGPHIVFGPGVGFVRQWLVRTQRMDAARRVATKVRQSMRLVPAPLWGALVALHLIESPGEGLRVPSRSQGLLLVGDEDDAGYLTSGRWDVLRATRTGAFRFAAVSDLHHVPMAHRQRVQLLDLLEPELYRYATVASPAGAFPSSV